MEAQISLKEHIYNELIENYPAGKKVILVPFYKKVGCSIAYLSSLIRYGRAAGFFDIDVDGDYITTENLPQNYDDFRENMNEKSREIRAQASGKPISKKSTKQQGITTSHIPKEEPTFNAVISFLKALFEEKKAKDEKIKTLIKYIKKLKAENENLINEMEKMI